MFQHQLMCEILHTAQIVNLVTVPLRYGSQLLNLLCHRCVLGVLVCSEEQTRRWI